MSSSPAEKSALAGLAHLMMFGTAAIVAMDAIEGRRRGRGSRFSLYRGIGTPVHLLVAALGVRLMSRIGKADR